MPCSQCLFPPPSPPLYYPQVRTHLRNMVIIPEMIGSVVGVYNGKTFNQVKAQPLFGLPLLLAGPELVDVI